MSTDQDELQPLNVWQLANLGYQLHIIRNYTPDEPLSSSASTDGPPGVIERLQTVLNLLARIELQESVSDFQYGTTIGRLKSRLERDFRDEMRLTLGENTKELRTEIKNLEKTIRSEASSTYVYPSKPIVGSKNIARFINEPMRMFEFPIYIDPPLPKEVDYNIAEAGRCLAIGFTRAAALFTLLATEATVKYYYEQITKKPPINRTNGRGLTWKEMNGALKARKYNCSRNFIESGLDELADIRNKAMHAEKDIDDDLLLKIWTDSGNAIRFMLEDLKKRDLISIDADY